MTQFNENIRKIAKTEELKRLIEELRGSVDALARNAIPARRGVGFKNEGFNSANANQNTAALNAKNGSSQFYGTGKLQPPVGGDQGSVSADSFLDNTSGLFTNEAGDDAANPGDQLRELTGLEDCSTGKEYKVRFDGAYDPPTTWAEAGTPPGGVIDETYVAGFYYTNTTNPGLATIIAASANIVLEQAIDALITANPNQVYVTTGTTTTNSAVIAGTRVFTYQMNYESLNPDGSVSGGSFVAAHPQQCTGSELGDAATACAAGAPTTPVETEWPEDPSRPVQLSWNVDKGTFAPSEYDPDVPFGLENGLSTLNLCTTDGKFVTITPLSDGGFAIYETGTQGGSLAVDASIKKVNRDLTYAGTITEDQLDALTPQ